MVDAMHDAVDAGCILGSSKQSTNGEDIKQGPATLHGENHHGCAL